MYCVIRAMPAARLAIGTALVAVCKADGLTVPDCCVLKQACYAVQQTWSLERP